MLSVAPATACTHSASTLPLARNSPGGGVMVMVAAPLPLP